MTADEYLAIILSNYQVYCSIGSSSYNERQILSPVIKNWANASLLDFDFSGSTAKGTGVKGSTDVDFFISLSSQEPLTLKQIYDSLFDYLTRNGYTARRQNVSIGLSHNGLAVDLTPGKKQSGNTNDHSIYRNKLQTWTLTNVQNHINIVKNSGRIEEIKLAKIWRNLHKLDFPSFYLELTVMNALSGKNRGQLANNFWSVLTYLRDSLVDAIVVDPSNTGNVVSDDLYKYEKQAIADTATQSLSKKTWDEIVW